MKIVQVSAYFPPHLGGMQNVAREISERLAKKGHQVEVFTSDVGCPKDKQLKSNKNLEIHYLPARKFFHTPVIYSLYKKLKKIPKNAIIHVHVSQAYVPEIVYRVSKKREIPYVAHIHGDPNPSSIFGKIILEPYKKTLLKLFLNNSAKIMVLTQGYKELFKNKYNINKNKIIVIPNGVGEEFFTKDKTKYNTPHLLFVGRICGQKNPIKLIESVSLCKSKFILDIVGDGDLLEETKMLVKEKGLKNVIFHGRKEGKDLINMYKNSDAFILTSNEEAFPLTILEAMASKLPVIASDVKGNHDVVKDVGILVDPPTPENFAKEIDKLFSNKKLYNKLSKQSFKFAKEHKWDNIITKFEKVYEEVLSEHNKKLKQKKK